MTGCRCPHCWGLAEYLTALTGRDHGLPPASGHHRLHVVTAGPPGSEPAACQGTYTCPCAACTSERAALVQAAAQRNKQAA